MSNLSVKNLNGKTEIFGPPREFAQKNFLTMKNYQVTKNLRYKKARTVSMNENPVIFPKITAGSGTYNINFQGRGRGLAIGFEVGPSDGISNTLGRVKSKEDTSRFNEASMIHNDGPLQRSESVSRQSKSRSRQSKYPLQVDDFVKDSQGNLQVMRERMQGMIKQGEEGSEDMMLWDSRYCDSKNFKRGNSAI
jgi:hypothetical protein